MLLCNRARRLSETGSKPATGLPAGLWASRNGRKRFTRSAFIEWAVPKLDKAAGPACQSRC